MIAHHDELHMTDPAGRRSLAAVHVRREVLEQTARNLSAAGWSDAEIVPCRACVARLPLAA